MKNKNEKLSEKEKLSISKCAKKLSQNLLIEELISKEEALTQKEEELLVSRNDEALLKSYLSYDCISHATIEKIIKEHRTNLFEVYIVHHKLENYEEVTIIDNEYIDLFNIYIKHRNFSIFAQHRLIKPEHAKLFDAYIKKGFIVTKLIEQPSGTREQIFLTEEGIKDLLKTKQIMQLKQLA